MVAVPAMKTTQSRERLSRRGTSANMRPEFRARFPFFPVENGQSALEAELTLLTGHNSLAAPTSAHPPTTASAPSANKPLGLPSGHGASLLRVYEAAKSNGYEAETGSITEEFAGTPESRGGLPPFRYAGVL